MIPRDKCMHVDNSLFLAPCRSPSSQPSADRNVVATLCRNYSPHFDRTFASGKPRTSTKASRADAHMVLTTTSKLLMLLEPIGPPLYWSTHSRTEHKISRSSHGRRRCIKIYVCHMPNLRRNHEGTLRIKSKDHDSMLLDVLSCGTSWSNRGSSALARTVVHVTSAR